MFTRAMENGLFTSLSFDSSVQIFHLFYADDAILIGEWKYSNISNIVSILQCFFMASGLNINVQKSHMLGVCVPFHEVELVADSVGCAALKTPFIYIGSMVGGSMSMLHSWDSVVQRVSMRLSKWKVNTLSVGGCLTLLKSVFGSIPTFCMSFFKFSASIIAKLEKLRSNLFKGIDKYDKKISWIA